MGFYINPKTESKEDFLRKNATPITLTEAKAFNEYKTSEMLPVVLVCNPAFTAVAVAFSTAEMEALTDPNDLRPKRFFMVAKNLLDWEAGLDSRALFRMVDTTN